MFRNIFKVFNLLFNAGMLDYCYYYLWIRKKTPFSYRIGLKWELFFCEYEEFYEELTICTSSAGEERGVWGNR